MVSFHVIIPYRGLKTLWMIILSGYDLLYHIPTQYTRKFNGEARPFHFHELFVLITYILGA